MRGARGAVPLALAVIAAGLGIGPASAATVTTLYVQNGQGSDCSDSGPGTFAAPFCTISKAASVVQPGQTVNVGFGDYPEQVTITAKGTAAAPITFVGQAMTSAFGDQTGSFVGSDGSAAQAAHAFVLDGAQHVTVRNFGLSSTAGAVLVEDSQDVTVDQDNVVGDTSTAPDVQVAGASSGVTISRDNLLYSVEIGAGATGTVVSDDVVMGEAVNAANVPLPAVRATDAPGTVVVNDTVTPCAAGIDLEGASTGSTIENDIVEPAPCGDDPTSIGITVAAGSVSGTTSDYNIVNTFSGVPLYSWAGTTYTDLPSFTAATGQGGHDSAAPAELTVTPDSEFNVYGSTDVYPSEGSPEIDSANAAAPGELGTDVADSSRVDDPLVPNSGTGVGYYDRGAYEFQDPIALNTPTLANTPGDGPLDVTLTTGVTAAWSNNVTYTDDFGDGTPVVTTAASSVQHSYAEAGYPFQVGVSANDGYASTSRYAELTLGADYQPMTPVRLLDTRHAVGVPTTTPIPANGNVTLTVAGVDGIPSTPSAVTLNVTATAPTKPGFITVYPDGQPVPNASNVNFSAGETVANLVTVPVQDGKVVLRNSGPGTVHVIADAEGYYADSGYGYRWVTASRVLDTRVPTGVPTKAPVAAGGTVRLDLSSAVPAGTAAVTLNVTATNPTASGDLIVYPDGAARPGTSNLNFTAGQTVPNLVTVPVNDGKVDFYNASAGTVNVIADLSGYYGDAASGATSVYVPITPTRVEDTRIYGTDPKPLAAHGTLNIGPSIQTFAPDLSPANATGAIMNVTVTEPTSPGDLVLYPSNAARPGVSNLNFLKGETVANLVNVGFGPGYGVDVYNAGAGTTELVVDLEGFFIPPLS